MTLRRAALLLALCLQLQNHLPAAAPLSPGGEAHPGDAPHKTQEVPPQEMQARSLPETDPDVAIPEDNREDLFQDVDPKALAALILQALHLQPEQPDHQGPPDLEPSANEERVRSETKSSALQPEKGPEDEAPGQQEEEEAALESMLQELQRYSPTVAKREEQAQEHRRTATSTPPESPAQSDVLKELEEYEQLRVHTKRKAPPSEPWEGARKLRQQQHLEHQLLQRRYEELAESRRQAEEARRAAAEEERLADMASDLLLQYLLQDGEGEGGRPGSEGGSQKGSSALLFEDEEGNVAEDKRSNEAAPEEDDDEDIDPNTIDRLIELSSKLHLPADDVIDIINDVEKKRKEEVGLEALGKGPVDKPKKTPPPYPAYPPPGPKPIQKSYYPPARQPPRRLPKEDEDAWNEVLRGDEYPAPKWLRAQPDNLLSNYINPRTFQPLADHHHAHFPGLTGPRAEDEELENYLEKVLLKRPQGF